MGCRRYTVDDVQQAAVFFAEGAMMCPQRVRLRASSVVGSLENRLTDGHLVTG
jgi:hypothetical protein